MKNILRLIFVSSFLGVIITFTLTSTAQSNRNDQQKFTTESPATVDYNTNDSFFIESDKAFSTVASSVISVEPDSFDFVLNEGDSASSILQISNLGSTDLIFDILIETLNPAKNQNRNRRIPNQSIGWNQNLIFGQRNIIEGFSNKKTISRSFNSNSPEGTLPLIISDPVGDGGLVDVTEIRGTSTSTTIILQLVLETELDPFDFAGLLGFDVDQDPFTGVDYPVQGPNQDVGCEFYITYFNLNLNIIDVYDQFNNYLGSVDAVYDTKSFTFEIPLSLLGGDDGQMNIAAVVGNNSGPTDWIPDEGHGILGASWLTVEPISGTVLPGNTLDVNINITTVFLDGGEYLANILISSNDPDNPEVIVPTHLHVIGVPDIAISDDSLDFGEVFVSFPDSLTLIVSNEGSDILTVNDISSDNPDYTVDLNSFSLNPGEDQEVQVIFTPSAPGPSSAMLSITSDDPDEPMINVFLQGEGLIPPGISIAPTSFTFDLFTGETDSAMLTITNSGGSPLNFNIRNEGTAGGVNQKLYWTEIIDINSDTLHSSNLEGTNIEILFTNTGTMTGVTVNQNEGRIYWTDFDEGSIRSSNLDGSDIQIVVSGLSGPVDIAIDPDDSKIYWTDFSDGTISRANLDGSGIEVIIFGTAVSLGAMPGPIETASHRNESIQRSAKESLLLNSPWGIALDLNERKVYWTEQSGDRIGRANLDGSGIETIIDFGIDGPRGIKLDVTRNKIYFIDSFNNAIKRSNLDASSLETLLTFEGVNPLDIALDLAAQKMYWTDNVLDQVQRANFDGSNIEVIIQESIPDFNGPIGLGLSTGASWLSEIPTSGTIPADSSMDILLKIDASGLFGGTYDAIIIVGSNDPDEPEVTASVTLNVTGAPDIAVSDDSLDFEDTFVGFPDSLILIVSNEGTDLLTVSDISSDNPDYTVDTTTFSLNPGEDKEVQVSFNPSTPGPSSATLTITSNDPDEPMFNVFLEGEGILPPVISVIPDSYQFDLVVGDSVVAQLTIDNSTGLGELYFELSDRQISAPKSQKTNPYSKKIRKSNSSNFSLFGLHNKLLSGYNPSSEFHTYKDNVNAIFNPAGHLPLIVSDPIGDGENADIKEIRGGIINDNLEIEYVFADGINMSDSLIAVLYLDVDRDPMTGVTDSLFLHDLGVDYFVYYYPLFWGNEILIFEYSTGNEFSVPYSINGTTIAYSVPLSFIGNDDGEMDLLAVSGYDDEALDWAPDEGHATLFADAFWLSENPTFGTILPGGNMTVEISLNTDQLIGGDYHAAIDVNSNDPVNSFIEIPVTLNLIGVPQISISTDSLNFGETYLNYYNSLFFSISSVGTDSLIGNITSGNQEFIVLDSSFVLPVGDVKVFEVQFHPAEIGLSSGNLTINSNASQVPLLINLFGEGVIAPNIATDTTSFIFVANSGDTLSSSFKIYNTGGVDLIVEISDEDTGNSLESSSDRLFGAATSMIYEIDPNSGNILNSFSTPVATSDGPTALAFSGEYLFFTDAFTTLDIYVLDPQTGSAINSYPSPSFNIDGLAFIEPYLYAMDFSFSIIYVLDSETGSIINTITPPAPVGGGIDGGNGRLFTSDFGMNIYELNPENGSIINSFTSVNFVHGLGFTGSRLFASIFGSGIDEYDPDTGNYIRTIPSSGYAALAGGGDANAEWLTETPSLVTIAAGDSATIELSVNTSTEGHYTANIILESNDPDSSIVTIQVTLDVVTGIEDEINLPTVYALYQNYPNPFNPATNFSYDLPEQSDVLLIIYNILGEEVATLINETQNAGRFNVVWDASHLASGIYLYRFKAGKFVETKKMLLLK